MAIFRATFESSEDWRVCTFAQANLSLLHITKISRGGSYGDLYANCESSKGYGETAPSTTANVCNHRCDESMLQNCLLCAVIKLLNKTFASLPRKTLESDNRFLNVISRDYDNSYAYFPQFSQSQYRKKQSSRPNSKIVSDLLVTP